MGDVILEMTLKVMGDAEAIDWMVRHIGRAGAHLMGSTTYREMAAYWPYASGPFAEPMNRIPKVVASRSGNPAAGLSEQPSKGSGTVQPTAEVLESWRHPTVLSGELRPEIAALKRRIDGEIILHGGLRFIRSMLDEGLVDESRFVIPPGGEGLVASILTPPHLAQAKLLRVEKFASGATAHVYRNIEGVP
jgi:dihydrofolate reductase